MDAIVLGLGQIGGTFAHGLLRRGASVHPVTRGMDADAVAVRVPEPDVALIAVGEEQLGPVLACAPWRDRLALVQNELLPDDWKQHGLVDPTIAIVWFEKKKDSAVRVVRPTLVAGPRARILIDALGALDIPASELGPDALVFELVRKNLYILTANIAGLEVGGTVSELWSRHRDLAADVATELVAIQAWRAGTALPHQALIAAMVEAFESDPSHLCTGRSAKARLTRALDQARRAGLRVPILERIARHRLDETPRSTA